MDFDESWYSVYTKSCQVVNVILVHISPMLPQLYVKLKSDFVFS
jgi:hypothetical protein